MHGSVACAQNLRHDSCPSLGRSSSSMTGLGIISGDSSSTSAQARSSGERAMAASHADVTFPHRSSVAMSTEDGGGGVRGCAQGSAARRGGDKVCRRPRRPGGQWVCRCGGALSGACRGNKAQLTSRVAHQLQLVQRLQKTVKIGRIIQQVGADDQVTTRWADVEHRFSVAPCQHLGTHIAPSERICVLSYRPPQSRDAILEVCQHNRARACHRGSHPCHARARPQLDHIWPFAEE